MAEKRRFRFSLRLLLVVVLLSLFFARLYNTSTRRAAFDRLVSQPCAFGSGNGGIIANPSDFLSIRVDAWYTDLIRPPSFDVLEIREPVSPKQRLEIANDLRPFPELRLMLVPSTLTDANIREWQTAVDDNVKIQRVPAAQ